MCTDPVCSYVSASFLVQSIRLYLAINDWATRNAKESDAQLFVTHAQLFNSVARLFLKLFANDLSVVWRNGLAPILQMLHTLGSVAYAQRAQLVCLFPTVLPQVCRLYFCDPFLSHSGLFQIMALFVHAADHRQRLFGRARRESSIIEPVHARDRLRTIQRLRPLSDAQLDAIMEALESWDIAFKLSDEERLVYNRPNGGYLFPSMRPSAELVRLPMLPTPADVASERWIAEQVRASALVRCIPFSP